jgi:hypothetical protein
VVESIRHVKIFDTIPNLFKTDSFGIYKFNHNKLQGLFLGNDLCNRRIADNWDVDNIEGIVLAANCLQVDVKLFQDTCNLCMERNTAYPFRDYLLQAWHIPENQYLKDYLAQAINEEGFRSISFQTNYDSLDKIKVLLIGDSFVWGLSAEPIFNCYSDLLLSKDYLVFNTGIPGTDPAQYAAIAEKYIPILKPDIIIVNFYVANDFMFFKREPEISRPLEYATTAGFIASSPAGDFLELDELTAYYKSLLEIPNQEEIWINAFCAKTRIGSSLLWPYFVNVEWSSHEVLTNHNKRLNMPLLEKAEISKLYIDKITRLAAAYQVPLSFVVIPEVPFVLFDKTIFKNKGKNKEALDLVFGENGYDFPEIFCKKDNAQSGHFNNQGSVKFANYLDELIKKKLQNP